MASISEIASKLNQEIYHVLDGQFYMNDGTKVTYNPCKDPRYPGCFYCSVYEADGTKRPTIILDPKTRKQVA